MKESLWNAHIVANTHEMSFEIADDKSNLFDFYSADVVGNRRFAQNYGGHPRSDIAEINSQVSLASAENLLRDLQVFEADNSNVGLTDIEIMLGHRSKYQQCPSEMTSWLEHQIAIRDAKRNEVVQAKENVINFEDTSNSSES